MKKSFLTAIAAAAFCLFGAPQAQAQNGYEVPPLDPELSTMINEVIDLQLSDPDKANKQFAKLMRKISKNKENLLAVGQAFLDKKVYPCANQCSKQIYVIAPEYIPGLMFSGEVCMLRKDYGAAGQKFDEVLSIDSTYIPALKRNAFVYKNVNPHVAIEMLQKIKNVEPGNTSADRELGDIYYNLDEYQEAVNNYKTYFTTVTNNDATDVRAAENYLQSLYAIQEFTELSKQSERFVKLDPNDVVLKRMRFFADAENYEIDSAKVSAEYITLKQHPDSVYIYLDYAYAGNLMAEIGDLPKAIEFYETGLKRDTTKVDGYKLLADLYRRNKQTDEGIKTYEYYLQRKGDKATDNDKFGLGRQLLTASQQKDIPAEKKAAYVAEGDKIFAEILQANPKAYQAALLRAAINITDGTKPEEKVKNLYETALNIMESDEDAPASQKLQALRYLAFYYVQTDEYDSARKYCNEILKLDPTNSFGKQIDDFLKSVNK